MKSIIYILAIFGMCLGVSTLSARAIHLLAIGDTIDAKIGSSDAADLKNVQHVFSYLAKQCNVPIYIHEISGNNLTFANFQNWLQGESVSSNDVIILYYTGHGGRNYSSPTMWPFGCFLGSERVEFTKMIEGIVEKKAALCLTVISSCNTWEETQGSRKGIQEIPDLEKLDGQRIAEGCKKLLFKPYGLIIASAAEPGRMSYVVPSVGGYLTCSFLKNFIDETQAVKPSWERIFRKTKSHCIHGPLKQTRLRYGDQISQHKVFLFKQPKSPRAYKWYLYNRCFGQKAGVVSSKKRHH